ncbi:MAG TPA: cytochrome c3 family protein [Anaeromyxobacter sp.]|nr:cytochrome c3 family protein [Anaeromyxobacter sp.]
MRWAWVLLLLVIPAATRAAGASVLGSKHDLSVSGPGPIKSDQETEVCIFCHVSHGGATGMSNRPDTHAPHQPYDSSTMRGRPQRPTGASRICLSCHDGTIAVGETLRKRIPVRGGGPGGVIPPGRRSNLGTDLRATHPISLQPGAAGTTRVPRGRIKLDRSGQVQCTSCHDPHAEFAVADGKFLVETNQRSELCLECHVVPEASSGSHFGPQPRAAPSRAPAGPAACGACHRSHAADPRGRLLSRAPDADDDGMCLSCHDGRGARYDIGAEIRKTFSHAIRAPNVHDAAEGPNAARRLPEASPGAPRHAVCVDCHEPHASAAGGIESAPMLRGPLKGTWGVDLSGRQVKPARYEYEICFKCHADSANQPQAYGPSLRSSARRQSREVNLRRVFDPSAPSFHPVAAPGKNPDVPSLKAPLSPTSFVYCSDCHGSDAAGVAPRGPHGSTYPHLLALNYTDADLTNESPAAYALCYKCHDRDVLLSARSAFPAHRRHVVDSRTPCSGCHNAHGISALAGTPQANAHLIDFDLSFVQAGTRGPPRYDVLGPRSGSCNLTCHDKVHADTRY